MGWWSTTVLGGDTPYDARGNFIYDVMGYGNGGHDFWLQNASLDHYRDTANSKLDELLAEAKRFDECRDPIGGQVLGALLMELGAKMPDDIRAYVIHSAETDEWASEGDEDRQYHINNLIEAVKQYPAEGGEPVNLEQEGLFQKLAEVMGVS